MTESPQFELQLMGPFGFRRSGEPDFSVASKKARALLAYVAMQEPMRSSRERLATLFWPERVDRMARQNLRACIAALRRDLGDAGDAVLVTDDETVALREGIIVDARRLLAVAATGEPGALEQAARRYGGPFLADLTLDGEQFSEWALAERERLDAAAGAILAKLANSADAAGDGAKALEFSSRLAAIDPFREDWLRLGLQISARHLGRDKALKQARSFAELLKKELDVEPDADTAALIAQIRTGSGAPLHDKTSRLPEYKDNPAPFRSPDGQAPDRKPVSRGRRFGMAASIAAAVLLVTLSPVVYRLGFRSGWQWLGISGHGAANGWTIPIVVSPFQSQGANTGDLARDLTADILADVSRFSGLTVFDGRTPPENGWGAAAPTTRFRVSGSVRRPATVARVSVALTDTTDQTVVWADDYDLGGEQTADTTDNLSRRIARALQVQAAYALAQGLDETKLQAAPLNVLVAKALTIQYRSPTLEDQGPATALYEEVLRRDRDNPLALIGMAARLVMSGANMLTVQKTALTRAELLVKRALRSDPRIERAHYWLGNIYLARGQRDLALQSFERALKLNPSFIPAEALAGYALVLSGRPDDGLRRIEAALAESAHDPTERLWLRFAGIAQLERGNDAAAIEVLTQAASLAAPAPPLRAALASAYALTGERAKSREQLRLMKEAADPAAVEQLLARAAGTASQRSRYLQGLHLAASDPL